MGKNPVLSTRLQSYYEVIESLDPAGTLCPCCGKTSQKSRALYRKPDGTFFKCPTSGLVRFSLFSRRGQSVYAADYFFSQYRQQYGRTYLEDFSTIKRLGTARIGRILHLAGTRRGDLLDIGCAYGPFLAAAAEAGFRPYGFDIAEDPVRYVRETLGFPAMATRFPDHIPRFEGGPDRFSVVSLWYVIEHFESLIPVWQTLDRLLLPGGILAFSTPNARGISARRNFGQFLENSPEDHFSVMDPVSVRKMLKGTPFRVRKIVITGHHPERFIPGFDQARHPLLWKLLGLISRLFGLGDTFEVYAVKTRGADAYRGNPDHDTRRGDHADSRSPDRPS